MALIGLRRSMFAPISEEPEQAMPIYGQVVEDNKAISANITWSRSDDSLYANDVEAETDNGITGGTITMGLDDLSESLQISALGTQAVGTEGDKYLEDTDRAGTPGGYAYLRVRKRHNVVSFEANFLYKITLGQEDEETATRGESIEWQTPEVTGKIMGVYTDASGEAKFRRRKTFPTEAAAIAWLKAIFVGETEVVPQQASAKIVPTQSTEKGMGV